LVASSSSVPLPQHDPLAHKCLNFHSSVSWMCRGIFSNIHILAPFSPTPTSSNTTLALTTLHLKSNGCFPLFLEDYKPYQRLKLSFDSIKLIFQHMPQLSTSGPFGMIFKHLWVILFSYHTWSCSTLNCMCL